MGKTSLQDWRIESLEHIIAGFFMAEVDKITWGSLSENIEEQILDSIRKGMSSGEHIAIRPLREVFQNSDDESADRFFIRIDEDALYFMNDGNRLTVVFTKDNNQKVEHAE